MLGVNENVSMWKKTATKDMLCWESPLQALHFEVTVNTQSAAGFVFLSTSLLAY